MGPTRNTVRNPEPVGLRKSLLTCLMFSAKMQVRILLEPNLIVLDFFLLPFICLFKLIITKRS